MPNQFEIIEIESDTGVLVRTGEDRVLFKAGATGYFDDGTNFRITVEDGIITAIEDSITGGHS